VPLAGLSASARVLPLTRQTAIDELRLPTLKSFERGTDLLWDASSRKCRDGGEYDCRTDCQSVRDPGDYSDGQTVHPTLLLNVAGFVRIQASAHSAGAWGQPK
jgi:hypothetical protein